MKNALIALFAVMLTGCKVLSAPAQPAKFPEAPEVLTQKLPDLIPLDPRMKKPKELLDNAAENYGICYQYLERSQAWENWYREQKTLYEKHNK
jgi:hypothetical protein